MQVEIAHTDAALQEQISQICGLFHDRGANSKDAIENILSWHNRLSNEVAVFADFVPAYKKPPIFTQNDQNDPGERRAQ